jgi:phage gpG-like protein
MVTVRLETLGTRDLIQSLSRIGQQINNFSEPFRSIAQSFWKINEANLQAEGKPERFKQLTYKYQKWKHKAYPGKKIMQLTGRLYDSLTAHNQTETQDTIAIITPKYAELGTNTPYANAHQEGVGNLPERKVVQITEKHEMAWARIIQIWAYGLFEKQGFETSPDTIGGVA